MKRPRIPTIVLLTCWVSLAAAPTARAGVVKVEFAVNVLPAEKCGEQRDATLAQALAGPGTKISGEMRYDANAPRSPESNPEVADYYYFDPSQFYISVAIGRREPLSSLSRGTAWISSSLLSRGPGQPTLAFAADSTEDLSAWPGEIDRLVVQLVLRAENDAPRIRELPLSSALNSLPLSKHSRFEIVGERLKDAESHKRPAVWIVCGEVVSFVASEQEASK